MVGKKKHWKTNNNRKVVFYKYCKLRGHKEENCAFLHPEKAPKGWKVLDKAKDNKVQKTSQKAKKHPRDQREEKINLLITSGHNTTAANDTVPSNSTTVANNSTASSTTSEDTEDIEFEDVLESSQEDAMEVNNNILTLNNYVNSITNPQVLEFGLQMAKTVELASGIKDITDCNHNHNPPFIFDTGATVHVISNKSWFSTYKQTDNLVSWGQAKTLRVQGEGSCKIKFIDSNIIVIFRKCYHIPELGINIIAGTALPSDVA